jgi:hypothetical protein
MFCALFGIPSNAFKFNRFTGSNSPPLAANDSNDFGFNTTLLAAGILFGLSTGDFRDNQDRIIDSTARTVGSNQKIANQIFSSRNEIYTQLRGSIYEKAVEITFGAENYSKVIRRIVRGLYWRQTDKFLGKTTKIDVFPHDGMLPDFAVKMKELMDCLQPYKLNGDTFIYKVCFTENGMSIWEMQFFGRHTVFAYAAAPKHEL